MTQSENHSFLIDGFPRNQDNLQGWTKQMGDKVVIVYTVPVRCDHQVQCVPGVLSMGNDSPHMYRVRTIENEMITWEILV